MSKKTLSETVTKQEPKIYFTKYLNKYVASNKYELAFLKGSFKATERHTVSEWDALVEKQLNRKLV